MRSIVTRLHALILLLVAVLLLTACVGGEQTQRGSSRPDPGPPPEDWQPAWVSDSHCIPGDAEHTLNSEQYRAALECSFVAFEWPDGKYPDIDRMMQPEEESPYVWNYQIGLEHTQLGSGNTCAWYMTWLEARQSGEAELEQEALHHIVDVVPNYGTLIDGYPTDAKTGGTLQRDVDIAAAASLGDPSLVQNYVDRNCASDFFLPSPPPGTESP